ncbi:hypothetical protein [Polaribacter sp. IC073]|uniref:hypothetical protein n=1 Tax=Polaribacter sp. IC073 TaxID=2508540 RepID=UPI0011BF6DD9|nr:hypothetical protein [Polaribacter sp. IC073]TXD45900.1 hypothetical protein ES045_15865 [Polaribacter sp. IC073]
MEDEELKQVEYDCKEYLSKIKAIKNARSQMIEFKGKPREETCRQAIDFWKRDQEDIKRTLIPYMKRLIKILENNSHVIKPQ